MEVSEALRTRISTRKFTNKTISFDTLKAIVDEARKAPSWVNSQPYTIYLAMGEKLEAIRNLQEKLEKGGQKGNSELPVMARNFWSERAQKNMKYWTEHLGEAQQYMGPSSARLYDAPAVVYLTLPEGYSDWSLYDLGSLGNSIILSATARGIASMTAYQFVKYPEMLHRELEIPKDEKIIIGIGLGYRDKDAKVNEIRSSRNRLEEVLKIRV